MRLRSTILVWPKYFTWNGRSTSHGPSRFQSTLAREAEDYESDPSPWAPEQPNSQELWEALQSTEPSWLVSFAMAIRREPEKELPTSSLPTAQALAELPSYRLPIITAQMALRQVSSSQPQIRERLCSPAKWAIALNREAYKGHSVENFQHWIWVLTPADADERIARFLSQEHHKPIFLVMCLLDRTSYFKNHESFRGLLAYCIRWYSKQTPQPAGPLGLIRRSLSPELNMTADHFVTLIRRLTFHCRRLLPQAFADVAQLAARYIQNTVDKPKQPGKAYKTQCDVFNSAIQELSEPAKQRPYANMHLNWHAITVLLSLSSKLERPLAIQKGTYHAIRMVLLGMRKLDSERDTTTVQAATWPPYRMARDGMEEEMLPEDYQSRVLQAGNMMQEAGYDKSRIDHVMDTLGGMSLDGSPTIQTRAVLNRRMMQNATARSSWAAQVRATRNVEEAWAVFRKPPKPGMEPDLDVYEQMIRKLTASPARLDHSNLPGDGRETHPYDYTGLSEFEMARIRPPKVGELVDQLLKSGMVLKGSCLLELVRTAPTLAVAMRYLHQSTIDRVTLSALSDSLLSYEMPSAVVLAKVSRPIAVALVELICRNQPAHRAQHSVPRYPDRALNGIRYALGLTKMISEASPENGSQPAVQRATWAAWAAVLRGLSRPNVILSNTESRQHNTAQVLEMFMEAFEMATARCGTDATMFQYFSAVIQEATMVNLRVLISDFKAPTAQQRGKHLLSLYDPKDEPEGTAIESPAVDPPVEDSSSYQLNQLRTIRRSQRRLKEVWDTLRAVNGPEHKWYSGVLDEVSTPVRGHHILAYMRTLAFLGDFDEMACHLRWTIDEWYLQKRARSLDSDRDVMYVERAIRLFRAFAEPMLAEEVVAPLRESICEMEQGGFRIHWPGDEEVDDLVLSDGRGNQQKLRLLLQLVRESKKPRDGNQEE